MISLLCDFHNHTVDDPRDKHVWHKAEELMDKAAAMGYGALAITLHGRQYFPQHWQEYAAERGIILVSGVEQDIEGCHVLLLNFDRDAANGIRTFAELAACKREDNLVIAAHPFFPGEICLGEKVFENAELWDALEVTGFYHSQWNPNAKAIAAAQKLNLPVVGNSDTHTLDQFGSTSSHIEIEGEPSAKALVQAVKAKRVQVQSRALSAFELGRIGYKVVGRGYMPWIDYKRTRGVLPAP
jgi:predicted metal-dependent phosphoesterase TrpH